MVDHKVKETSGWYEFEPVNKLNHQEAKSEGPMLNGPTNVPTSKTEQVSNGNEERHVSLLIVDDDEVNLRLLSKRLFSGVNSETANTLESAKTMLKSMKDCKVLLTDFNLNELETSTSLITMAKELFPNVKVIVMSGNASDAKDAIELAGVHDATFFLKPYDVMKLSDAVLGALMK